MENISFACQFEEFVCHLASECNWHEHTPTCFKHLAGGEQPSDSNCRMRIDGTVCLQTMLDPEMHRKCFTNDPASSESTQERNLLTKTVNAMMGR